MSETKLEWTELAKVADAAAKSEGKQIVFQVYLDAEVERRNDGPDLPLEDRLRTYYDDGTIRVENRSGLVQQRRLKDGVRPTTIELQLKGKYPEWRFGLDYMPTEEDVAELKREAAQKAWQAKYDRLIAAIEKCFGTVTEQGIRKSVFEDAKQNLGWLIDHAFPTTRENNFHNNTDLTGLTLVKRFPKALPHPTEREQEMYDTIAPLSERMIELRPRVFTGRPDGSPLSQRQLRLKDSNVGHCGICGRDIIMRNGKISHHGYFVPWEGRTPSCFGTNYDPIETSPAALQAYQKHLEAMKTRLPAEIERLEGLVELNPRPVMPPNLSSDQRRDWYKETAEASKNAVNIRKGLESEQSDLRHLQEVATQVQETIAAWEPGQIKTITRFIQGPDPRRG